jgi:hypothetical protein
MTRENMIIKKVRLRNLAYWQGQAIKRLNDGSKTTIKNFNLLEEIRYAISCEYYKVSFDSQRIDSLSGYFEYVRDNNSEDVKSYEHWLSGVDTNQAEVQEDTTIIFEYPVFNPFGNQVPEYAHKSISALCCDINAIDKSSGI